jgi:hypothetical protein
MNHLILMAVVIPILVLIAPSHLAIAYKDPKHCYGYDGCFVIGYNDGHSDAEKGISPAYACVGHSQGWCDGYNSGYRAGNGGTSIYDGPNTVQRSDQSAEITIHGNNNKISINQQTSNQVGDNGFSSSHWKSSSVLSNCVILCLNSDIRIK